MIKRFQSKNGIQNQTICDTPFQMHPTLPSLGHHSDAKLLKQHHHPHKFPTRPSYSSDEKDSNDSDSNGGDSNDDSSFCDDDSSGSMKKDGHGVTIPLPSGRGDGGKERSHVAKHSTEHDSDKPISLNFPCLVCGIENFDSWNKLREHYEAHGQYFICRICGAQEASLQSFLCHHSKNHTTSKTDEHISYTKKSTEMCTAQTLRIVDEKLGVRAGNQAHGTAEHDSNLLLGTLNNENRFQCTEPGCLMEVSSPKSLARHCRTVHHKRHCVKIQKDHTIANGKQSASQKNAHVSKVTSAQVDIGSGATRLPPHPNVSKNVSNAFLDSTQSYTSSPTASSASSSETDSDNDRNRKLPATKERKKKKNSNKLPTQTSPKKYPIRNNLNTHSNKRDSDKRKKFQCEECPMIYWKKKSLQTHIIRSHLKMHCSICDVVCSGKLLLARHLKKFHMKSPN